MYNKRYSKLIPFLNKYKERKEYIRLKETLFKMRIFINHYKIKNCIILIETNVDL